MLPHVENYCVEPKKIWIGAQICTQANQRLSVQEDITDAP